MGYVEDLLGDNEQILVRTRQHWIVLASTLFANLVTVVVIFIVWIAAGIAVAFFVPLAPLAPFTLAILVLLIFPAWNLARNLLAWWNEEYMVTNRRVIQAEGTINKHVIDSSLEKVNDVVLNQTFFGRMLDYGNIEILTASEIGVNNLHNIASPVKFKTAMLNSKESLGVNEPFGPRHGTGADHDVPTLIAELDELRKQGVLTEAEFEAKKAQLLAKM